MGREIEKAAIELGHEIIARLDIPEDWDNNREVIRPADVVIEFSTPGSVVDNIRNCFDLHLPVVVGTTGWNDKAPLVKRWCEEEQQAIFTAANFSIGVNILFSLTGHLSGIINKLGDYNITLEEIHHIHKLDAPSGTAIKLAEIILKDVDRKKNWVNREQENDSELQVISVREGEVPGIHTIECDSPAERLILRHEAKGRRGFVSGALMAAEWLQGKKGYFTMKDMLNLP